MLEADARKAAFLRSACRSLGVPAKVVADRIENVTPLDADVVTARALAPLCQLLPLVKRHLCPTGIAILPKGRQARSELASAREAWSFEVETLASQTDPEALILRVSNIIQKM
jgi:16S rRNA (guanine527-N7)-methyltransferase